MDATKNNPQTPTQTPAGGQVAEEPPAAVEQETGKSKSEGLSQAEATRLLDQYGYNELPEEQTNWLLKFLSYFWGPIPWMIEIAAILSAAVQHWPDFGIILVLLLANGAVGFWEEHQAGNAIAALKKKLALRARVKRDGQWAMIPARELVPGDLIRLRIGDIVPADAELLEGDEIHVDQSALTGESLPVQQRIGDTAYSGAVIRQGEMDAVVKATGQKTYFGKTTQLVQSAHTESHFQRAIVKIGDFLIVLAVILVIVILITALFRGDPLTATLQFALVLTVAAIPVALPTVLSVTMAVGARLLAKHEAIVSRLASIEELAGMDILCSDKTGTLTQNRLTLGDPHTVDGASAQDAIRCGALASRKEDEDPIDLAVIKGLSDTDSDVEYEVTHFQPFDPVRKRTEATVRSPDGSEFKVTKGAPQVILKMSSNADQVRDEVDDVVNEFAARGFRSLGVARSDRPGQWRFLAVLPLYDPPREDSRATVHTARKMGSRLKMVTGDQVAIGKEIARQLGMGTNILDAELFAETRHMPSSQLAEEIERADGFAQVYPEHKYQIVEVLQRNGHIVGMTGDGVNDAPALKKADVGIAVSGATDAARGAADIVLLSPGLSVIIRAIEEARKIFQRMTNYAVYRIAETIRVLLFMTLSILVFNFYPVTAVMIVLLALLNDGAILSIAYDHVRYSNRPEEWNMRSVLGLSTILGIAGVIASFGLFFLAERVFELSPDVIQSLMYLKLSVAGHLTVFVTRTRGPFWSTRPAPILFWAVVGTQLLATLIAVYGLFMAPIGWQWALVVWGYALAWFVVNDVVKLVAYRIFDWDRPGLLSKARWHSDDAADQQWGAEAQQSDAQVDAMISSLVAELTANDPVQRTRSRQQLVRTGSQATGPLVSLLQSPVRHFRWEAAKTLSGIADPQAIPALIEALDDRDQDVRWVAGEAMIAIGRDAIVPLLHALISRAGSVDFCHSAHHVFSELSDRLAEPELQPVLAALQSPTSALAAPPAAELALERLHDSGHDAAPNEGLVENQ